MRAAGLANNPAAFCGLTYIVRPGDSNRRLDAIEARRFAKDWEWLLAEQIHRHNKPEPVSTPVIRGLPIGDRDLHSSRHV